MKIVVTGATGFIGRRLIDEFVRDGDQIVALTRGAGANLPAGVRPISWDGRTAGSWDREIDGADAVVNLAGEPFGGRRWNAAQKEVIISSRVDATRAIVDAIARAQRKPSVLVNASAVGIYGEHPEGVITEDSARGTGFVAETCGRWEDEASRATTVGVRLATMRLGIVLGEGGGALQRMLLPYRLFIGGPLGPGTQWFPWIHLDDVVGAIRHVIATIGLQGPVNVSAPNPVTMNQFARELGEVLHRPALFRVPAFALRIAVGEMAIAVLSGQQMIPRKLLTFGYKFRYSNVNEALGNILT
jgi:uncharacterized protein (TIGR01777 family)